jgi:predicted GH43/DUF377 family glycosyl hydrolase
MLHRPMNGAQSDFSIELALSSTITGKWINCGKILEAYRNPLYRDSWVGGGSVPIPLRDNRYLMIYHTGNWHSNGERVYSMDVAILNFNRFSLDYPAQIIEKRFEHLMVPETRYEKKTPNNPDNQLDCLFPCGSYEYKGDIYIIYGGADHYVLAAKVNRAELLRFLEENDQKSLTPNYVKENL